MHPDVSPRRVTAPAQARLGFPTPFSTPLLPFRPLSLSAFCAFGFVTVRDLSPKFLLLYTSANGDPARFLFPISLLFFLFLSICPMLPYPNCLTFLRVSRDPPLLLFVVELIPRLSLFLSFAPSLYSLAAPAFFRFPPSLPLLPVSLRVLVSYFLLPLFPTPSLPLSCPIPALDFFSSIAFFHPATSSVASFTTTLSSTLSFYFISHLPLSASFESAFPCALFTSRSFSRIVPVLLLLLRFVLSSFPVSTPPCPRRHLL